ncbi:hypothetical protein [uncultured Chloroflexus sp.]|uniref:hypothetical protein n=1 Tax=uncultured Chloroflexus sp. TaxID=214040 RepID=UPI002614F52B|nr:hypothetical protein [uncultured Chloroflexus sp.]
MNRFRMRIATASTSPPATISGHRSSSRDISAARQQPEAAVGVQLLNDLQPDAVGVSGGRRWSPRIAVLDERHVDRLANDVVGRFRQRGDRRAGRFVGGRDDYGRHRTRRIIRHVDCAARAPLLPVIAGARAAF